jgi:hypothetical protein
MKCCLEKKSVYLEKNPVYLEENPVYLEKKLGFDALVARDPANSYQDPTFKTR